MLQGVKSQQVTTTADYNAGKLDIAKLIPDAIPPGQMVDHPEQELFFSM